MTRNAFYSFHYKPDNARASQVRNMGVVEGNQPASDNDWETITGGGDEKIKAWINEQMKGRSCVIVLVGAKTANRKWINYEIVTGWNAKKGVLAIYVHNLKDLDGHQSAKGENPLDYINYGDTGKKLSSVAKAYDPPYSDSKLAYAYIKENLADWIEAAIAIRDKN
jgi:hypothetical protein